MRIALRKLFPWLLPALLLAGGGCDEEPRPEAANGASAPTAAGDAPPSEPPLDTPPALPPAEPAAESEPEPGVDAVPADDPAKARRQQVVEIDTDQWMFEAMVPLDSHLPEIVVRDLTVDGTYVSTLPVEGLGELTLTLRPPTQPGQPFPATLQGGDGLLDKAGWGRLLNLPGETALVLQFADPSDNPRPADLHFKSAIPLEQPLRSFSGILRFDTDPKYLRLEFERQ